MAQEIIEVVGQLRAEDDIANLTDVDSGHQERDSGPFGVRESGLNLFMPLFAFEVDQGGVRIEQFQFLHVLDPFGVLLKAHRRGIRDSL